MDAVRSIWKIIDNSRRHMTCWLCRDVRRFVVCCFFVFLVVLVVLLGRQRNLPRYKPVDGSVEVGKAP